MIMTLRDCQIRLATQQDAAELARLRWDFSDQSNQQYAIFAEQFTVFLQRALMSGTWAIWVAEYEGKLIANIYVQLVEKVPRPGRPRAYYGFVTNVYSEPFARNQGIGSQLMRAVQDWARERYAEFLVVWPSEESVRFYQRAGFVRNVDILECDLHDAH